MDFHPHLALIVAAVVFSLVALMHLLRLVYRVQVRVANKTIPMWVSGVGFFVSILLSLWMMKIYSASLLTSAHF